MTAKVAVSMPEDLLVRAKKAVRDGRAKSVSALVSEALMDKLENDELARVLAEMDVQHGAPGKEAEQWAENVMARLKTDR
jgi:Arc/MetJ-type ribon-helix-helix transcriptional regulator